MTFKFLYLVYVLFLTSFFEPHEAYNGKFQVTIRLTDGKYTIKAPKDSWKFPDVETMFNVSGKDVTFLRIENSHIDELSLKELEKLPNLMSLEIVLNSRLKKIHSKAFRWNQKLSYISLDSNSIDYIAPDAFHGLFKRTKFFGALHLLHNKLRKIPTFGGEVPELLLLSIGHNPIRNLRHDTFINMTKLEKLQLENTGLEEIPGNVFENLPELHYLDLSDNKKLARLHSKAFVGATGLSKLYLNNTGISSLPHLGLEALVELHIANTPNLWDVPNGIVAIQTLKTVRVSSEQRFLCCAFEMKRSRVRKEARQEEDLCASTTPVPYASTKIQDTVVSTVVSIEEGGTTVNPFNGFEDPTTEDPFEGFGDFDGFGKRRKRRDGIGEGFVSGTKSTKNTSLSTKKATSKIDKDFEIDKGINNRSVVHSKGAVICVPKGRGKIHFDKLLPVECTPEPDALRPCDDIMGNIFLTGLSWIVAIIALLGNSMVFSVLVLSKRTVTVTKFLLMNLSFADLCLALYLFILVSASGHTHGNYYNYVRLWQYGGGCGISGFLAIFSSQLSMLVLVVITVERYFAIVYAMHFQRRVTMKHARIAMLVCWLVSLIMAMLPLIGVNGYNEVALCLPFKVSAAGDIAYIGILLLMNVMFFIFVLIAYIRMYCVVRSPHLDSAGPQRNDSEVAKRMALLVFTDFFCWGPIAFVGMMSAFGSSDILGIDVKKSKYLLVIFFPINSLCNPFLYAVSTNSFKRDVFDLLIRCGLCRDSIAKANEGIYSSSVSHKYSKRNSETMTLQSQISRGSSRKKDQSNLLSKLLVKRHINLSSNGRSPMSPETISPSGDRSNIINDDVFYKSRETSPELKRPDQVTSSELPDCVTASDSVTDPLLSASENDLALQPDNENLITETTFTDGSSIDRKQSEYDDLAEYENDDDENEHVLDDNTLRFSQYDLTPESFRRAKETSVLL